MPKLTSSRPCQRCLVSEQQILGENAIPFGSLARRALWLDFITLVAGISVVI